jgi:hypothetical protein
VAFSLKIMNRLTYPHDIQRLLDPGNEHERYFFTLAASEQFHQGRLKMLPPTHFLTLHTIADEARLKLLNEIREDAWGTNIRTSIAVQRETTSIVLMDYHQNVGIRKPSFNQYTVPSEWAAKHPQIMEFLELFCANENSWLQRALIVRLDPNGKVYPHVDQGTYYAIRDRYHVVLDSPDGSLMQCDDQQVVWQNGSVNWFNNKVMHQAFNQGDKPRIHLIFDALPYRNAYLVEYLHDWAISERL